MENMPLIGEPLALDFVNTRVRTPDGRELDLLATQDGLRRWLVEETERVTLPPGVIDLEALHTLRAHIAQAIEQVRRGLAPPVSALRALSEAQRGAPAHQELSWDGSRVAARPHRSGEPTRDLLAELAEAAAELLTGPSIAKVRRCEGPQCQLMFLAAHPSRRWCSPALCGNRVRVARYYQRNKVRA